LHDVQTPEKSQVKQFVILQDWHVCVFVAGFQIKPYPGLHCWHVATVAAAEAAWPLRQLAGNGIQTPPAPVLGKLLAKSVCTKA